MKSVPISAQTREAIADGAANLSRQAGVVAAGAVAVSSQAGPYGQPAKAVAVGATVVGFGADAVEQIARPNTGQVVVNSTSLIVQTLTERLPFGGVGKIGVRLQLNLDSTNFIVKFVCNLIDTGVSSYKFCSKNFRSP